MDLGKVVKVHTGVPATETKVVSVPEQPSVRRARIREWERRAVRNAPVPVESPAKEPERVK